MNSLQFDSAGSGNYPISEFLNTDDLPLFFIKLVNFFISWIIINQYAMQSSYCIVKNKSYLLIFKYNVVDVSVQLKSDETWC